MRSFLMVAVVATVVGTLLAPIVRRIAFRVGFLDRPDGHHKRHNQAVPLGGGVLIMLSIVIGLAAVAVPSPVVRMLLARDVALAMGFLGSCLTLIVVGTIDDARGMRGLHKLMGQIFASLLLTSLGLEIRQLELLGWTIDLGVMSVPFTVFWLLGSINAFNLLDGIDGLTGLVALVISLFIVCISIISGHALAALVSVATAGGCLAFLHTNFPPAKMFLGDTGSMLLGLLLGGLTIVCCSNGPGLMSLAPAVALLALPIFDTSFALLRRRLTGRSIYMTDRGHLHHCLLHALDSHLAVLLVAATACAASGLAAVISIYTKNDVNAIVGSALVVVILVAMRLFGHVECRLLLQKLAARATRFFRRGQSQLYDRNARAVAVQLQGERQWTLLWESLTEWGHKLQLLRIVLDVNLPAMREGFHADWFRPSHREKHECWQLDFPLFIEGSAVGRLVVAGDHRGSHGSVGEAIESLVDLLEPFEQAFAAIVDSPVMTGLDSRTELPALARFAGGRASSHLRNEDALVSTAPVDTTGLAVN